MFKSATKRFSYCDRKKWLSSFVLLSQISWKPRLSLKFEDLWSRHRLFLALSLLAREQKTNDISTTREIQLTDARVTPSCSRHICCVCGRKWKCGTFSEIAKWNAFNFWEYAFDLSARRAACKIAFLPARLFCLTLALINEHWFLWKYRSDDPKLRCPMKPPIGMNEKKFWSHVSVILLPPLSCTSSGRLITTLRKIIPHQTGKPDAAPISTAFPRVKIGLLGWATGDGERESLPIPEIRALWVTFIASPGKIATRARREMDPAYDYWERWRNETCISSRRVEPREEVERLGRGTGLMGTGMQCIFHLGYLFIL